MGKKTNVQIANEQQGTSVERLLVKRKRLLRQFEKYHDFCTQMFQADSEEQLTQLQIRTEKIELLLEQVNEIDLEIELLDKSCAVDDEFEDLFFAVISETKKYIGEIQAKQVQSQGLAANYAQENEPRIGPCNAIQGGARLPNLGLPRFRGEYSKWTQFKETFDTLISKNPCLDDIQKFYYLLDTVEGDARSLLESLEITRENYKVAWQLLENRFNNKPVIIQSHLRALFDLPAITEVSYSSLRNLVDNLERNIRALKALGEPVQFWDRLVIFALSRKLDSETKRQWEELTITKFQGNPELVNFTEFISNKCRVLENIEINVRSSKQKSSRPFENPNNVGRYQGNKGQNNKMLAYGATCATGKVLCEMCKGTHFIYRCEKLLKLEIPERVKKIKQLRLCLNCLRGNHFYNQCLADGCKNCSGKHNTLVCTKQNKNTANSFTQVKNQKKEAQNSDETFNEPLSESAVVATSYSVPKGSNEVLLSTAKVHIKNKSGEFMECRALLDSASQMNFMRKDLAYSLGLKLNKIDIPISGVGKTVTKINQRVTTNIKSRYNNFNAHMSFLVLENITADIPVYSFSKNGLNLPKNIKLADPELNETAQIDILIGAEFFYELLCAGQIKLDNSHLVLQKSVFGWVVSGKLHQTHSHVNSAAVCNLTVGINSCHDIQSQLEKFWALEEITGKKEYSIEEQECEQLFLDSVRRDKTGRFSVALPVKYNIYELGDSLEMAKRRFYNLECKLEKNLELKQRYHEFMTEYEQLGHMSKIDQSETNSEICTYVLPHHGVLNDSSITTKLRVVFDGSARTTSGLSLNDALKVGPNIQEDIFNILIRFRQHNVVITADIAKMYRQINVQPKYCNLQQIVWRENSNSKLKYFRLNTVTYGTAPASFLATRCLRQIALDIKNEKPEVSKTIARNFYVDDLITGAASVNEAIDMAKEIAFELNKYGFPLRKWSSNEPQVLQALSEGQVENLGYYIASDNIRKTLGVFWEPNNDVLEYIVKIELKEGAKTTKRFILSEISKIFDPLNLVGPVIINAKILLQRLWMLKLDWDESVPLEFFTRWNQFYKQLSLLNEIKIPRQVTVENSKSFQLHGFCDASEQAYGACVYLRSENDKGKILVRLVCAKSRVAPLKIITLPRLELLGAVLLARLTHKVTSSLDIKISDVFLWSDSTIVLSWLKEQPSSWKVFVAHRVAEIQELTENFYWGHVISSQNPADFISRGVPPSELKDLGLWWSGPEWLMLHFEKWPQNSVLSIDNLPERKKNNLSLVSTKSESDSKIFARYSSLNRLMRITALCLRFAKNCKTKDLEERKSGKLTVAEYDDALYSLLRAMQKQEFKSEISSLTKFRAIPEKSSIKSLDPFVDSRDGLLRVGGRIRNSNLEYKAKFPIVLPPHHSLTKLIILDQHHKDLHAGTQAMLASLRQNYWPIKGRSSIKGVLSKCMTCFRSKPVKLNQKMGNLPRDRVTPQRPFSVVGVDFAGPFNVKDGKLRNRTIVKGYMCLFICFCTKAVHIELVGELSTQSFLNCLKRFVSRRGLCSRIYSDNATNLVGSDKQLKKIFSDMLAMVEQDNDMADFLLKNRIEWKFIPGRSPHQGGLWESAIKMAKFHITRVIGDRNLTFEDLATVFAQVEAALNSRPLTPFSTDQNDFSALTPGHFLIGDALNALPQKDVTEVPLNRLNHYSELQKFVQLFWKRWSKEYVGSLQQRNKWRTTSENLQVGTLVLLIEDNQPPLRWKLGRIITEHPGDDGVVRVVTVRTQGGTFKRAVQKVCVLPIKD